MNSKCWGSRKKCVSFVVRTSRRCTISAPFSGAHAKSTYSAKVEKPSVRTRGDTRWVTSARFVSFREIPAISYTTPVSRRKSAAVGSTGCHACSGCAYARAIAAVMVLRGRQCVGTEDAVDVEQHRELLVALVGHAVEELGADRGAERRRGLDLVVIDLEDGG